MSDLAVRVQGLAKEYHIGARTERYKTLRDSLAAFSSAPARWLRRRRGSGDERIWALHDVSFDVHAGEVVGIIGRNGAGKSTLLKILARITEPTRGSAEIRGRVGSLLEVGTGFHPELTGRENIFLNGAILGMRRLEIDRKFDEIVAFSGVEKFIDTPVKRYSSGMHLRLAFAVAAHLEPEILLVDEVLAVGDAQFQAKCLGKMRSVAESGRTVLLVSHNMEAIASLCARSFVIENGRIGFDGSSASAISFYYDQIGSAAGGREMHVLFEGKAGDPVSGPRITRVEVLDPSGVPCPVPGTWDDIVIRVCYESPEDVARGSVIVEIRDQRDQRLVVLDSGSKILLRAGAHFVDCLLPRLPLAAGQFMIGAGLARGSGGWIWRDPNLAPFRVYPRDVLDLGRAPVLSRMTLVLDQRWSEGSGRGEIDREGSGLQLAKATSVTKAK